MVDYKCPYCGQNSYAKTSKKSGQFTSWKEIRAHTSRCKINDKSYMICEYYGPIRLVDYSNFSSIEEFKSKYPKTSFNSHQWKQLRKVGKSQLKTRNITWSKELIINSIKNFYSIHNRIPQKREFTYTEGMYPDPITVRDYFSTWNKAIEAAGFTANYNDGLGIRTTAKDGNLYRSKAEAYFVDNYLLNKYTYQYELPYGNGWYYDFYIKELDLYIEIDGGLRPQRIQEKIEFNKSENKNFLVLSLDDIYNKNKNVIR